MKRLFPTVALCAILAASAAPPARAQTVGNGFLTTGSSPRPQSQTATPIAARLRWGPQSRKDTLHPGPSPWRLATTRT